MATQYDTVEGQQCLDEASLLSTVLRAAGDPQEHVVFVTSYQVSPTMLDHCLDMATKRHSRGGGGGSSLPEEDDQAMQQQQEAESRLRARITMVVVAPASGGGGEVRTLARAALQDHNVGRLRRALRHGAGDPRSSLSCFTAGEWEQRLADSLGLPLRNRHPDPARHREWGTKSGSRRAFVLAGVPHPRGSSDPGLRPCCFAVREVAADIRTLWATNPSLGAVMVKLNDGFSGLGNAVLRFPEGVIGEEEKTEDYVAGMMPGCLKFGSQEITWDYFSGQISAQGAIVEEFVECRGGGGIKLSPEVDIFIQEDGRASVVAVHEQLLTGHTGQYWGCSLPANSAYRAKMIEIGEKVGAVLSSDGVRGPFGIDTVAVSAGDDGDSDGADITWDVYSVEINLRQTAPLYPLAVTQLLTDSHFEDGLLLTTSGKKKAYISADFLEVDLFRGSSLEELLRLLEDNGLVFSATTKTGVVVQIGTSVEPASEPTITIHADSHHHTNQQHRTLGFVGIGDSPQDAARYFHAVVHLLCSKAPSLVGI
ncbi:carboxylate-amine ligase [Pelomyxa schiedti]|nr:carboxylate-amine ligase [Pelomyxa schiedti]